MSIDLHDPGGRRSFSTRPEMRSGAIFSDCQRYRLLLWREWGDADQPAFALWIGMNPSTATGVLDDPTIRREIGFTQRLGLRRYVKTNVMDYRATDPSGLTAPGVVPCSDENLPTILKAVEAASIIILAYGNLPKLLSPYALQVVMVLRGKGKELWTLGKNRSGSPKHPLYVRGDAPLIKF